MMRVLAIAFVLHPLCAFAQPENRVTERDYVAARSAFDACLKPRVAEGRRRKMRESEFYTFIMSACPAQAQRLHEVLLASGRQHGPPLTPERQEEVAANGVRALRQIHFDGYMRRRQGKG